jgi:hypothetical protein
MQMSKVPIISGYVDFLPEFLQKDKSQNTGGQATQRTDDNEQDNSQSVVCRPV